MSVAKTGNPELDVKIEEWLAWDKNPTTISEIESLVAKKDTETLENVLLNRLSFGTAGLRGVMAAGYSRMNDLVIIQTTQGLGKYALKVNPDIQKMGVVLGFDGRHNSNRFAKLAAVAFLSKNIPVYLYSELVATPFIPFAVKKYKAGVGIMVTASHNPKDDNGYKVYWDNGSQIIAPHDKGIQASILENLTPWTDAWDLLKVVSNPLCKDPLQEVLADYFDILEKSTLNKDSNAKCPVTFTFTPMHGVSGDFMKKAFERCSFRPFIPVKEQMAPDPDFPTVKFPNPEEGKCALDLSIKTADANMSTIILANDPDADRLAVAEKQTDGNWKIFTGNEIGALLGWWMWHCWQIQNPGKSGEDVYMIASTVSSKILGAIAQKEGFNFIETLTGFKWMGNKSFQLINEGKTVLLAFEEAIGFMCGTTVLDKDGITAAIKIAELTASLGTTETPLTNHLKKIYETYGYHICRNSYYLCHDQKVIKRLFTRLRNFSGPDTYPKSCGKFKISHVRDLTTGFDSREADKKAVFPSSKSSQMITFWFENGSVATLRTSGTEPKVKYYTELCAKPDQSDWLLLEKEVNDLVTAMVSEFMEPEINKLIPRID